MIHTPAPIENDFKPGAADSPMPSAEQAQDQLRDERGQGARNHRAP